MVEPPSKRNPAASFTDDIIVEILRRLPIRSVCQFKCVSRSWCKLISYSVHREKLPQTLEDFFYRSHNSERWPASAHHFTHVTGKRSPFTCPSFAFLPAHSDDALLLDSCNGLLLCRCYQPGPHEIGRIRPFHYAVCNPATKKWVMLPPPPDGSWDAGKVRTARLGFDPTVSSHFHVIEYVKDEGDWVTGVEICSSKTAAWSFKESEWGDEVALHDGARSVFLHGSIHMLTGLDEIISVDMDGQTWRTIPIPSCDNPDGGLGCIHQSQGHLYFLNTDSDDVFKLSIWILEDYGTHEWKLKHTVSTAKLFRNNNLRFDLGHYTVITVHPECNSIFFVFGWECTLMAYEMDRKEVRVIRNLGRECMPWGLYLPYVPLFSKALADEQ